VKSSYSIKYFLLIVFALITFKEIVFSQPEELTQDQYDLLKDEYAVSIIKLMVRLDTLNSDIDKLKQISEQMDSDIANSNAKLYTLVGASESDVNDFRKKLEETEKRINSKTGSPADARSSYFDEISGGKIRCLPEFQERYISMKKRLEEWEGIKTTAPVEGTYIVVKGDCLWKISELKYNSPYYWPVIWEANKNGVVNKDELPDPRHQQVTNPNLIYPGQVLKIPQLGNSVTNREEFKEKIRKFRRIRKNQD
jgi:LysM domain